MLPRPSPPVARLPMSGLAVTGLVTAGPATPSSQA